MVSHSCSRRTWVDLPGALAALEGDEHPTAGQPAAGGGVPAERGDDVGEQRDRPAVVHLPVGQRPRRRGRAARPTKSMTRSPVTGTACDAEVDLVLADQPHPERHDGQRQDQRGPHQRLDDRERAPADLVLDLGAEQREAGEVGDAGEEAHEDDQQQRDPERERPGHAAAPSTPAPTMATPKIRSRARSRAMLGPKRDAEAEADEDRAEQQPVGGVTAAERVGERLTGRDDHAGGGEGAGDADDQTAHQRACGRRRRSPCFSELKKRLLRGRPGRPPAGR